jgi:glycosyltransferase involved in cell wall biosynthesis
MPHFRLVYLSPVRICIVARVVPSHGIGGMQDHTADLARGLVVAGHEVELITARHPHGLPEEVVAGVRRHHIDAPSDDFTNREWRQRSHEAFVQIHARDPFDVVHGEGSSALELVRRGVHRATPFVVMFHGNFLGLVKASLRRQLRAKNLLQAVREQRGLIALTRRHFTKGNWTVFRECEAIVPSAQQVADTCRSHRLDPARVHVVPNGVDTSVFHPGAGSDTRGELGLASGFLFVCGGRLSRDKGTHHALKALALGGEQIFDARLVVIGDGEERGPLERMAAKLGLGRRVLFVGAQPPERMPALLNAADAFLFPTERDEAAPMILPQAMACGLPVIASRCGGITEVIDQPNGNGILVPPGDVSALLEAATRVYRDGNLRRRLADGALRRVLDAYTLERMVEATVEVYRLARERFRGRKTPEPEPTPRPA